MDRGSGINERRANLETLLVEIRKKQSYMLLLSDMPKQLPRAFRRGSHRNISTTTLNAEMALRGVGVVPGCMVVSVDGLGRPGAEYGAHRLLAQVGRQELPVGTAWVSMDGARYIIVVVVCCSPYASAYEATHAYQGLLRLLNKAKKLAVPYVVLPELHGWSWAAGADHLTTALQKPCTLPDLLPGDAYATCPGTR